MDFNTKLLAVCQETNVPLLTFNTITRLTMGWEKSSCVYEDGYMCTDGLNTNACLFRKVGFTVFVFLSP